MSEILDELIVATDDEVIFDLVESNGGRAMMTADTHRNGTERVWEVSERVDGDIFVCIFGDEPMMNPEHIEVSVRGLVDSECDASILGIEYERENSTSDVKMVLDNNSEVIYLSRLDVPYSKTGKIRSLIKAYHLLSFTKECLDGFVEAGKTRLEELEDIEHLRLIESGFRIIARMVESDSISLDTKEDLEYITEKMTNDSLMQSYSKEVLGS